MVGSTQKLREDLANLFKTREAMTTNIKTKSSSRSFHTREAVNRNTKFQENTSTVNKNNKPKKTGNVKMEQGREPLSEQSSSKKVNGKLNGGGLHKEYDFKKKTLSSEKLKCQSSETSRNSYTMQKGVKKQCKSKQTSRNYLEVDEDSLKSRKQAVNNKNLRHKAPEVTKVKESKVPTQIKQESKKQSRNIRQRDKIKKEKQAPESQQTTNKAKKRNLKETEEPAQKKFKPKVLAPSNDLEIWEQSESLNESDTTEEYSDTDSTVESEYDTDSDDSFDLSCDDYEYSDEDDSDENDSDEYSVSLSDKYSDDYEDDSLEEDNFQEDSCSDPDYELPNQEVEDLIVHKGLAVTYKLKSHHGVEFDESDEESHIVELPDQTPVKTVKQHESYDVEHLRTLELNYIQKKSVSKATLIDEECPKLVPIEQDDEGFQLWTSGITMDDEKFSDYEQDSDESSTLSYSDVNRKYLQRSDDYDSSDMEEVEEEESSKANRMQAFVVDVTEENTVKIQTFREKSIPKIEDHQSSLEEIISKSNVSLKPSNVKILKAPIKHYNENKSNSLDQKEGLKELAHVKDQQLKNSVKKHGNFLPGHQTEFGNAEFSFDTTKIKNQNLTNVNTTEENFTTEMDIDFVQEISEDTENTIPQNESTEMHFDQGNEADHKKMRNFHTKFCNSMDSYYVLVLLKTQFFIYGTVKAKLIAGSTEIYGYKLKPGEMVTLNSPRGCSSVPLKPISSLPSSLTIRRDMKSQIFADIEALSNEALFNPREVKRLLNAFDPTQDAILILTRNEAAAKIKHVFQKHVNENLYPAHIPQSRPFFSSETMIDCMVNASVEYALQIPPKWLELRLKKNSKFMLIGGKSVGKSTLLRYLLNKHLDDFPRILLIDLDIGQPEIFVPQTVSCALLEQPLIGPGFLYQIQPDKAYAIGHTNFISCAHTYMRAVLKLLHYCATQSAYSDVPWLINTMGYNKGFGGELISVLCGHLQPTDIIQLQSNKPVNNFDMLFEPCVVANMPRNIYNEREYNCLTKFKPNHKLHIIPSAILQEGRYQKEWQMSAKDMRFVMVLARLSAILPDEDEWINNSETFCHDLQKLKIVNLTARDADEMETLKSLESNLVYLCCSDSASLTTIYDGNAKLIESLECLGIGIVRGVDYHNNQIFIMPALQLQKLCNINCLALGEMPMPSSLLKEQNPEIKHNVPFVQVMNDKATSRAVKQFFSRT